MTKRSSREKRPFDAPCDTPPCAPRRPRPHLSVFFTALGVLLFSDKISHRLCTSGISRRRNPLQHAQSFAGLDLASIQRAAAEAHRYLSTPPYNWLS